MKTMKFTQAIAFSAAILAVSSVTAANFHPQQNTNTVMNQFQTTTDQTVSAQNKGKETIVETASSNPNFTTFIQAVIAADLVNTLQGKGPYTVFVPSNEAFAKLNAQQLRDLLKAENKAKLAAILSYHVIPGKILASDVKTGKVKTLNGKELDIKSSNGTVTINGAKVTKTDIVGSNGVIHVIDTVLMP